ncbi:MAG TPA: Gfo/Idh/MocA family oxidoreductase [Opitutales bacterium]|nr:Gfo/Idh/MocA family oxidoreductase [Opitutales bacterium]
MKLGIIGTGWVTEKHLAALEKIETAEVVAIAGRNQARARELARPFGAKTYENYLPMLERESLDAVFILLPPHLHGDLERACAEHVGAVLIEKPVTTSLEQAREIDDTFKRAGTLVSVGYQNRYRESVQQARACFTENTPGIMANGWWIEQMPPPPWWRRMEESGGQFVEQCTHLVDLSRYLMGEITEVSAYRTGGFMTEVPDLSVDDGMVVNVRYASGGLGSFCTGCFPLGGHSRSGICLNLSTRKNRVVFETWDFAGKIHSGDGEIAELPATEDAFLVQNRAFLDAVADKDCGKILSDYEDAMRTLAATLAANESAREANGAPVKVPAV